MDIYYRLTIENIARFADDPNAIPSMVKISEGVAQSSENVTPSISIKIPEGGTGEYTFGGNAQVGHTLNWKVLPVMDPSDVAQLRAIFRYATIPTHSTEKFLGEWKEATVPEASQTVVTTRPQGPTSRPAEDNRRPLFEKVAFETFVNGKKTSGADDATPVIYEGSRGKTRIKIHESQRAKVDGLVLALLGAAPKATDVAQKSAIFQTTGALLNPY